MDSDHFPSVAEWFGTDFWCLEWIWNDFEENENFEFFKHFFLDFKHILCINPSENGSDFDFLEKKFKNEAFNQKSETVVLLGYM